MGNIIETELAAFSVSVFVISGNRFEEYYGLYQLYDCVVENISWNRHQSGPRVMNKYSNFNIYFNNFCSCGLRIRRGR